LPLHCHSSGAHPAVHSFPTRRSSDLALTKPQDAIGRVSQYPLATGEQILPGKFAIDRSIETFSNVIPPGKRAIAVVTSEEQGARSEEHTSELQSLAYLVCRLLLEKKK